MYILFIIMSFLLMHPWYLSAAFPAAINDIPPISQEEFEKLVQEDFEDSDTDFANQSLVFSVTKGITTIKIIDKKKQKIEPTITQDQKNDMKESLSEKIFDASFELRKQLVASRQRLEKIKSFWQKILDEENTNSIQALKKDRELIARIGLAYLNCEDVLQDISHKPLHTYTQQVLYVVQKASQKLTGNPKIFSSPRHKKIVKKPMLHPILEEHSSIQTAVQDMLLNEPN